MITAFLKAYWKPLALLVAVVLWSACWLSIGRGIANADWQAKWSARDLSDAKAEIAARRDATDKTNRLAAAQAQAAEAYEKGKTDAQNEADSTIAAYRAGSLRLRAQFTCFNRSVPNTTTSTGISDAARDCGLSETDVSNLVRLAERADQVAHQLRAAQDIIRADREIVNGSESSEKKIIEK